MRMGVLGMVCCRPHQSRNLSASCLLAVEPMKQEPPFLVGGSAGRAINTLTIRGISSRGRASYGLGEITIRACLLLLC